MTLVPSLEEKKDPLNAGVLHPLFALALAKQGGLGGVFRSWQGSLLHSMKCKWGPITKHVGVSLVSLSERSVCARPGLEEGGSGGNGALWMVGTPLPPDTMLQREGSGPLGPCSCRSCGCLSQEPVILQGLWETPKVNFPGRNIIG